MTLRKKQRSRKVRKHRIVYLSANKQGRLDGFQRGKADGFAQGRANAIKVPKNNVAVAEPEHSPAFVQWRADAIKMPENTVAVAEPEHPAVDVLVITASIIPSLEICVLQPFSALKERENLQYIVKLEHEVSKEMIAAANTIVFVRNVEPTAYKLLEWAHELQKRTVYVIDDNFLEIKHTTAVGLYYSDPVLRETFIKFLRNAQIIKVDAPDFADYIRDRYNKNVIYFPASVDFGWLDQQKRRDRDHEQIVIGYEGGEKEEDFAPVIPALIKILDYYGGFVRLEFLGYVPAALADHPSVKHEAGGIEYKSFIHKLNQSNWDIGIAPLDNNPFNMCKTNNKLREYGACRIPGIYSDSSVYTSWVTQGETGYLVPHTEEGWYEGIKEMIENPSMRYRIKGNAEAAARQNFSLDTCLDNWKRFIFNT
ncbi:glycosyltransferase family 1 protein [Paenibacillus anaericanus]|uniref:Glycosyltransferase family 1 protein n=1 Tax=Paenibacillus anaericanus TaxID=170367 RepID=A0A3S1DZQ9_9BACL|nr:glycosyltransferase family 1 protein [Paenibacillus anaericanus]